MSIFNSLWPSIYKVNFSLFELFFYSFIHSLCLSINSLTGGLISFAYLQIQIYIITLIITLHQLFNYWLIVAAFQPRVSHQITKRDLPNSTQGFYLHYFCLCTSFNLICSRPSSSINWRVIGQWIRLLLVFRYLRLYLDITSVQLWV